MAAGYSVISIQHFYFSIMTLNQVISIKHPLKRITRNLFNFTTSQFSDC